MKRKPVLFLFALVSVLRVPAQVLSESFTSPFNPSVNGWVIQNNSAPTSSINWFQGNGVSTFSAYSGSSINDYYATNYNSTAAYSAPGVISNWLISPTVSIMNGATIRFATRTISTQTVFPDRLQVLICPTSTYNLPAGATSVGSFTRVVFDINPTLSTNTTAVQNNTTVTGYPQMWTEYTITLSGITNTVNGRFAFRYFVTSAGPVGGNSNYIGLDEVQYDIACDKPALTITPTSTAGICGGSTIGLVATSPGSVSATSFTWNTGANTPSIVVSPNTPSNSANVIYSVSATSSAGCVGTQTAAITVTASPNITVPSYTVCAGSTATIQAAGADSYSWAPGSGTGNQTVVSPTATTVYTVTGAYNGQASVCPSASMSTISIGPFLSIDVLASPPVICAGNVVTVSAISAADSYSWSNGSTVATFTASPSTSTTYSVTGSLGTGTNACSGSNTLAVTVNTNPVFSVSQTDSVCSGSVFSVSATGADAYVFMFPTFSSNNNPTSYTTSQLSQSATIQYSVTGTSTVSGCSVTSAHQYIIKALPIINITPSSFIVCINGSLALTASGANTYTWSGAASGNNATLMYSADTVISSPKIFYVLGKNSSGCTNTSSLTITVSKCTGIDNHEINSGGFEAYPNPFGLELNVSGFEGHIEIYNLLGQKVIHSTLNGNLKTIDTGNLPKGVYILKAFNNAEGEIKSLKLMRN